jgi:hypothetical protein
MALPKINNILYDLKLPSSGKKVLMSINLQ